MTLARHIGLLLAVAAQAAAGEPPERLRFADGLYARGMYEMAAGEYRAFLDTNPRGDGVDAAWYRMGESLLNTGRKREAEAALKKVVFDYPASPFLYKAGFRVAELAAEAGRPDQAANQWEAIIAGTPPPDMAAAALYRLGNIRAREGNTEAAIRAFTRIKADFSASPFYAHALLALAGLTASSQSEKDNAAAMLRAATTNTASPRLAAEATFQLGELEFRRGAWDASLAAYQQLAARHPGDDRAREAAVQIAWALHNLGRHAEVLQACDAAARARPAAGGRDAEWLYLRANALRQLKRYPDALDTYGQLLAKWPDDALAPVAAYERVLSLFKSARYKDAAEAGSRLKPKPELKADVEWILGESYAQLKDAAEAIRHYRAIVDQHASSPLRQHAWHRWAHALQSSGDFEGAARQYSAAMQAYPAGEGAAQALFASAYCLSRLGRHADAVRDWSALVQRFPDHSLVEESLYHRGMGLTHLKQDEQATAAFAQLLRQFPKSRFAGEAAYWSGTAQETAGKLADAEASYRAALASGAAGETVSRARMRLAMVLQRLGKPEESARLLDSLVAAGTAGDMPPEMLEWLAGFHLDRSEHKEALAAATALTGRADGEKRPLPWLIAARCRRAMKQRAEATAAYDKAITLAGAGRIAAEAALEAGELALEAGNHRQAGTAFDKAAALASEDRLIPLRAAAFLGKGRALRADGKAEEAGRILMSVAVLFDDTQIVPESLYEAARSFREAGKPLESSKAAEELRQRFPNSTWVRKMDQPDPEGTKKQ
jgi:TolA-binding protein